MTDKLPWMPFWGADFYESESVRLMTPTEEATYIRLLWQQWREESLPVSPAELRKLVGLKVSTRVLAMFPTGEDGRRRNAKMADHRVKQLARFERLSARGKLARHAHDDDDTSTIGGHDSDDTSTRSRVEGEPEPETTTTTGEAGRPETPALGRLINAMSRDPDRGAVMDFLDRVPPAQYAAWVNRLASWLQGLGFPSGVCPTAGQLATACSDYAGDFSPVHVRSFVLRVVRGEVERRTVPRGDAKTEATLAAAERFAKGA